MKSKSQGIEIHRARERRKQARGNVLENTLDRENSSSFNYKYILNLLSAKHFSKCSGHSKEQNRLIHLPFWNKHTIDKERQ